ncbi:hypothetical protein CSUI_003871 [Cystoisospora suis]|uniref:Transmembrane protein n=1 Tax=Cystoisospora suis TaxID=483139 RepID=A0A2C6KE43_9APIC|nr:hypothetical protein CSUI_003871 [Cystoisospora suis]
MCVPMTIYVCLHFLWEPSSMFPILFSPRLFISFSFLLLSPLFVFFFVFLFQGARFGSSMELEGQGISLMSSSRIKTEKFELPSSMRQLTNGIMFCKKERCITSEEELSSRRILGLIIHATITKLHLTRNLLSQRSKAGVQTSPLSLRRT